MAQMLVSTEITLASNCSYKTRCRLWMLQTFVSSAVMPQIQPHLRKWGAKWTCCISSREWHVISSRCWHHIDILTAKLSVGFWTAQQSTGHRLSSSNYTRKYVLCKIVTNKSNQIAIAQYVTISHQNSIRVLL